MKSAPLPHRISFVRSMAALPLITAFALAACAESGPLPSAPDAAPLYAKPGGGGGSTSSTVVISTIADAISSTQLYSIRSDGGGDYKNGVGGVVSLIQSIGDWVLENDARKSARSTHLEFTDVVSGTVPFTNKLVKGRFISRITLVSGTYQAMQVGDTVLVPLSFAFTDGGTNYGLRFNPVNQPGSEYARATCLSSTNNACAVWELTPSGTDGSLAILQNVATNSTVATVRMTFKITFRRP